MTVAIRDIETGLMDRVKKVLFVKVRLIFMFVGLLLLSSSFLVVAIFFSRVVRNIQFQTPSL